MGFLGLVPASRVTANYDTKSQTLTLFAQGIIQVATCGITFKREPWAGGLKFSLERWTGPLTGKMAPYVHEQPLEIHLPNKVYPSNNVLIVDQNNPKGTLVPITWTSGPVPDGVSDRARKPRAILPEETVLPPPGEIVLNVLFQELFTIQQPAEMPKFGTIDIKFDENFLVLRTSGINDGNIVWSFDAFQEGKTQIIVTFRGRYRHLCPASNIRRQCIHRSLGARPCYSPANNDENIPAGFSYLGRVDQARRIVMAKYPEAALYNAHATSIDSRGVTTPYLLMQMSVVFRDLAGNGTIIIASPSYNRWGPITYEKHAIAGNADIPLPIGMDADEADKILKREGQSEPFTDLTLSRPLFPGCDETYYQFRMVSGREVWIGARSGNVSLDGPTRR